MPAVVIDEEGNIAFAWTESGESGNGHVGRWFDRWGNLLNDPNQVGSFFDSAGTPASIGMAHEGEYAVAWIVQAESASEAVFAQR